MMFFLLLFLFVLFCVLSIIHESIFFSIFFLIALFLVSSFLFILLGFEFIGFLYLIVYVGAIAVLFLFMVMLFDKSEYLFFSKSSKKFSEKVSLNLTAIGVSLVFVVKFLLILKNFDSVEEYIFLENFNIDIVDVKYDELSDNFLNGGSNLQKIGFILYKFFYIGVFGAALVLLVGMIGAILLTQSFFFGHRQKKHQEIRDQIVRKRI